MKITALKNKNIVITIGAGDYYLDKNFELSVACKAKKLTEKNTDVIFANNYYQFNQVLLSVIYELLKNSLIQS